MWWKTRQDSARSFQAKNWHKCVTLATCSYEVADTKGYSKHKRSAACTIQKQFSGKFNLKTLNKQCWWWSMFFSGIRECWQCSTCISVLLSTHREKTAKLTDRKVFNISLLPELLYLLFRALWTFEKQCTLEVVMCKFSFSHIAWHIACISIILARQLLINDDSSNTYAQLACLP